MGRIDSAVTVVDADAHVRDNDDFIRPFLGEAFRNRRPPFLPRETYDRNLGGTLGHAGIRHEERLAAMDTQEIHTAVMYPTSGLGIGRVREPAYQTTLCRAYNEFIADYCQASPRLKAVANLPVNDPAAAARELRRAVGGLGLVGGMLAAQGHGRNFGAPEYYPLYEEAQKIGTPLAVHAFGGDEPGSEIFDQFISIHTTGHPFPVLRQLTGMVYGGIPELFPELKLGFLEIGCGWIPYWTDRMDEEWEKRGAVEAPECKQEPSRYITGRNLYYGCEPDEKTIGYVVGEIGSETIMYASDYPHWDMSWPESGSLIWGRTDLSAEAKRNILGDNARRFYGLE